MNILIIDDHLIIKQGLEEYIKDIFPKAICYFVTNYKNAISKINEVMIDLVICDLEFKNDTSINGFSIAKNILQSRPNTKLIAYSTHDSYRVMKRSLEVGFHSFLNKGSTFDDFSDTLLNVVSSGNYKSETMKKILKKRHYFLNNLFSESLQGISDLSDRERELVLLSSTTTDRKILAEKMNISPSTVDTHFKNVLSKLDLHERKELMLFSMEFKEVILKYCD